MAKSKIVQIGDAAVEINSGSVKIFYVYLKEVTIQGVTISWARAESLESEEEAVGRLKDAIERAIRSEQNIKEAGIEVFLV